MQSLGISKEFIHKAYVEENMDVFFKESEKIVSYLLVVKYKIFDEEERNDIKQDCLANLFLKHLQGKIKKYDDKGLPANLYSFVYTNSNYRILDHLKKKTNRAKKVQFVSYDAWQENLLIEEGIEE